MLKQHFKNCARRSLYGGVLALLAAAAVLVMDPAVASTHELPRERTLLVQVSDDAVEVMVVYLEPPGPTVDLLLRRYDFDGDAELVGGEAELAGREWIRRALGGLEFEVAGEQPKAEPPEIKFRREKRGSLTAAVYARWQLEPLEEDQTRTVHVRLVRQPENIPTELSVRTDSHTEWVDLALPDRLEGSPARPVLRAGEQASVSVRRISLSPQTSPAPTHNP